MHKFHFYFFSFFILSLLLSSCGGGSGGAPHPSDLSGSPAENSFVFYLEPKLHLVGKFQVMSTDGQKNIYETSLPVPWAPRDPDRPDLGKEPQVFPKEGFTLSNLAKGEYLFRVVVSHQGAEGETVIGLIETKQSVVGGKNSPLVFSKSSWVYPDDDGDGFSNIAELTDGFYNEEPTSPSQFSWSSWEFIQDPDKKSDPKDPKKHPTGSYLIAPENIHPTSPDDAKNSKLIGEILSVQAGSGFTVIHFASDGKTVKEKINFSSKIDGSFETPLTNSEEEDKVILVVASKMNGDQIPDSGVIPESDAVPIDAGISLIGKWMKITYRPLKIARCRIMKGVDPIAGSGYVLIEGEGLSADVTQSKIRFPTLKKNEWVYADESSMVWEGYTSRELKVKIPLTAATGYPQLQTISPRNSWGECPTNQPVIVLPKSGDLVPDLYIPGVNAPYVVLLGQTIAINFPIVNQGLRELNSSSSFPYSTKISKSGTERQIYPNSIPLDRGTSEKISIGLKKGEFVFPAGYQYFLIPSKAEDIFTGSLSFKAEVGPLLGAVTEQDTTNNSRVVEHSTFVDYVDLQFPWEINLNNSPISLIYNAPSNCKPDGCRIPTGNKCYPLKKDKTFSISLSEFRDLKNDGTFPLMRDVSKQPTQYHSRRSDDPLDTTRDPVGEEGKYRAAQELFMRKDYAEDEIDLKKISAVALIQQANLLNQRTELPILVQVYYSKDDELDFSGSKKDTLIQCDEKNRACEFCKDRLEGGSRIESKEFKELTLGPLSDDTKFNAGPGWLFIVAKAIQIDPKKVSKDKGVNYCAASSEERQQMHLGGSNQGAPLSDYQPGDNIIRVKIELVIDKPVFCLP